MTNGCAKEQGTSKYAWLFDYTIGCTDYGCNIADASTWGYWINTAYKDDSTSAWRVGKNSLLNCYNVRSYDNGVRPVITVSKAVISQ